MERTATVVGAGVGGLAAAVALTRTGWTVQVREAAGALGGGSGLVLWPNGLAALRHLGVDVDALGGQQLGALRLRRPDGRWHQRVAALDLDEPARCVQRGALLEALHDLLPPGSVAFGTRVDGGGGGADHGPGVTLPGGTAASDLVVAADGVRSSVRTALWPDCVATNAGYTAWRAIAAGLGEVVPSETWGSGDRVGLVPVGDGLTYVYVTCRSTGAPLADLPPADRFKGWHAPVEAALAALDPTTVLRHPVLALRRVPPQWHSGTTVLLGDAAHGMEPNLGQGACLALEDAVVLAAHLDRSAIPEALAAYGRERAARVRPLLRLSRAIGRASLWRSPVAVGVRDAVMSATPPAATARQLVRTASWRPPDQD